jgi:hypothetical protein
MQFSMASSATSNYLSSKADGAGGMEGWKVEGPPLKHAVLGMGARVKAFRVQSSE